MILCTKYMNVKMLYSKERFEEVDKIIIDFSGIETFDVEDKALMKEMMNKFFNAVFYIYNINKKFKKMIPLSHRIMIMGDHIPYETSYND